MGLIDNIGKFKIGGAINTQFQATNAVERLMIASGQQVGGFTSFLATIEFIGYLLLIVLSLFIISAFIIIHTIIFLSKIWFWIFPSKETLKLRAESISYEELKRFNSGLSLTKEEEEEINNLN